jgi:N-acetylneuraminate synthase
MNYATSFKIGKRTISNVDPTYFIADIGANHDGSLERAKELIRLAKGAGADCAKFQHFKAKDIVSKEGFADLKMAHQAKWERPVYEMYEIYSIDRHWDYVLSETARREGIDFMTTPYDLSAITDVDPYVKAFKIGSGDITYLELIKEVAMMDKPVFLATGASIMEEVVTAAETVLQHNPQLCLMQCNTNYTGNPENIHYVNLNVLDAFSLRWPGMPLGLSDHTLGHVAVLGAVALGAHVVEKHFTDDISRRGPDHAFAMMKYDWLLMRQHVREMEKAMGDGIKRVEENERESAIVQRRALRLTRDMVTGEIITERDIESLRPCQDGAFTPADIHKIIGSSIRRDLPKGSALTHYDISD